MTENEERNCSFQYAKISGQIFKDVKIVCDKSGDTTGAK